MALDVNELVRTLASDSDRLVIDKATIASQAAGNYVSMWRATGQPAQGAIPSTAAVCNDTTTGGFAMTQPSGTITNQLAYIEAASSNSSMTLELHDRLMHMGGLSGTVATAQTVGIDISANLATSNLTNRIGSSGYDDVQWWLEWYTATGATAVTATINVTYSDGSSGNLSAVSLAATRPASLMISLNSYRPAAVTAYIKAVNTVTLSATTGTAGSFGVTATRLRGSLYMPIANAKFSANWLDVPLSKIEARSCLFPVMLTSTTSTGTLRGAGKVAHMNTA